MKRRSTPQPLTRVDVWHLENVLFKLYRTIQSCVETVDSVSLGLFDLHDSISWIDKDTLITEFFEKPQYYEYGSQSVVDLTEDTFIRLRNFIIETQDLGLAIDQEMGSRKDITSLIAENLDSLHIKYRGQDRRPVNITDITVVEAAFDISV